MISALTGLKKRAAKFEITSVCKRSFMDRRIKDRILLGLKSNNIQLILIRKPEMFLQRVPRVRQIHLTFESSISN